MMQRFDPMDRVALFIAAMLIVGGTLGAILPTDFIIAHGTWGGQGRGGAPDTRIERVTAAHARFYGLSAIVGAWSLRVMLCGLHVQSDATLAA